MLVSNFRLCKMLWRAPCMYIMTKAERVGVSQFESGSLFFEILPATGLAIYCQGLPAQTEDVTRIHWLADRVFSLENISLTLDHV